MHLIAVDVAGRDVELVADRCWQAGASGLWEVDAGTLRVGVEASALPAFLAALADLGPVDVTDLEAVELAGRRSAIEVAGHDVELWVPPTVFGDGRHPTTATCLAVLPDLVGAGDRVLDVGCGAGALAIASALLGGRVTAVDIEPEAVAATRANAARNGVAVEASATPLAEIDRPFDVTVANMTTGRLVPLVPDLARCTAADGVLLLSGMLEDQWPAVRGAAGGAVRDVRVADGWVTAVIRR